MKGKKQLACYLPLIILLSVFSYTMASNIPAVVKSRGLIAYNYEFVGAIARHIEKNGFLKTGFGQPVHWSDKGEKKHYNTHPPLLSHLVALSFILFAPEFMTYESAATIVPTAFSLGCLALIYLIAKCLWNTKVAVASTVAMAFTPMYRAYSQMVSHEPIATFFVLAITYSYMRWMGSKRNLWLKATFALTALGCLVDWPVYYMIPFMSLHYVVYGKKPDLKIVVSLPLTALFVFTVFVAHIYLLEGDEGLDQLVNGYDHRSGLGGDKGFWKRHVNPLINSIVHNVRRSNTPLLFYSSLLLLTGIIYRVYSGVSVEKESYILLIASVGFIHNLLWPIGIAYHDYWSYYFTPAIALGAGYGLNSLVEADKGYREFVFWAALLFFWVTSMPAKLSNPI